MNHVPQTRSSGEFFSALLRATRQLRMEAAIEGVPARMLLQVHDELIFEVEEDAVDAVIDAARTVTEGAPDPAVRLDVSLVVDAGQGANWAEAH